MSDELEFSIFVNNESDETDQKKFSVDPTTGELRTGKILDREEKSEYTLIVGVASG